MNEYQICCDIYFLSIPKLKTPFHIYEYKWLQNNIVKVPTHLFVILNRLLNNTKILQMGNGINLNLTYKNESNVISMKIAYSFLDMVGDLTLTINEFLIHKSF